jgi:hypothetical protein
MLNQAHPLPLTLAKLWPCETANVVEREVHALLAEFQSNGEWFHITADHAIAAVEHIISIGVRVKQTAGEIKRKQQLKARSRVPCWTAEREKLLGVMWRSGASTRDILNALAALPGSSIHMSRITLKVKSDKLQRPEGYDLAHTKGKWSPERDAVLAEMYSTNVEGRYVLDRINRLPGENVVAYGMRARARLLGYKRPESIQKTNGRAAAKATRSGVWTDEREALLKDLYPAGLLPAEILQALMDLPGKGRLTYEVIRARAKHLGLRRPDGYPGQNISYIVAQNEQLRALEQRAQKRR